MVELSAIAAAAGFTVTVIVNELPGQPEVLGVTV
jgi:hypothetical protein